YAAVEIEPAQFSIDENTFGLLLFQILFLPVILCPGIPACRLWPTPPSFRPCAPIFTSLHPVLPAKQRGRVLPGRQGWRPRWPARSPAVQPALRRQRC